MNLKYFADIRWWKRKSSSLNWRKKCDTASNVWGRKEEENRHRKSPQSKAIREGSSLSFERIAQAQHTKYSSKLCLFATFSFLVDFPRLSLSPRFPFKNNTNSGTDCTRGLSLYTHGKSTSLPIQVLFCLFSSPCMCTRSQTGRHGKDTEKTSWQKEKKHSVFSSLCRWN